MRVSPAPGADFTGELHRISADCRDHQHAPGARAAVEERGAKFWILPPYSPDLSPVEGCGSKVKELTRAAAPRSVPQVYRAMGRAIGLVTDRDAKGWFQHAGYIRPPRRPPPSRAGATRRMAPPGERSRAPPAGMPCSIGNQ
ncbi:transposase [Sorangium sp. So ce204]|uniref:transposase n=1 Tax=Sorangium sp. So ce204 TaxID=3133288 RepID=UPI003F5FFA2F